MFQRDVYMFGSIVQLQNKNIGRPTANANMLNFNNRFILALFEQSIDVANKCLLKDNVVKSWRLQVP